MISFAYALFWCMKKMIYSIHPIGQGTSTRATQANIFSTEYPSANCTVGWKSTTKPAREWHSKRRCERAMYYTGRVLWEILFTRRSWPPVEQPLTTTCNLSIEHIVVLAASLLASIKVTGSRIREPEKKNYSQLSYSFFISEREREKIFRGPKSNAKPPSQHAHDGCYSARKYITLSRHNRRANDRPEEKGLYTGPQ